MRSAYIMPPALLGVMALFPPETRDESLAGCAALIGLFACVVWPARADARRLAPLMIVLGAAFPLGLLAAAPGAVIEPLAVVFLALAAGLATAHLPCEWRRRFPLAPLLALLGGLVALYAIYQSLWGLERLAETLDAGLPVADRQLLLERARSGRAFAFFSTPAALGGFLALVMPVTVLGAVGGGRRGRLAMLAAAALQVGGLLACRSMTAMAALLLAVLGTALVRPELRRRVVLPLTAAVLLLGAMAGLRGAEVLRLDEPLGPWRLRAANFRAAAAVIADRPWTGAGLGGFGEVYPAFLRPGDNETRHVHNLPLEAAAELGVPAGLLVAAVFFHLFLIPLRRPGATRSWAGIEIGLASFALHNLADFTAYMPSLLWSAAILRGWIAPERAGPEHPERGFTLGIVLAGTLLFAALASLGGLAHRERTVARQAAVESRPGDAQRSARRAVRLAPWNVDGRLLRARTALAAGPDGFDEALAEAERAVDLSPVRPAARQLRSELRQAAGDLPGAYADAVEAARLYPASRGYRDRRDALREVFRR